MRTTVHLALLLCFSATARAQAQVARAKNRSPDTPQESMVLIHGATFQMGIEAADIPRFQRIFAIENPKLFLDELPRHTVTVKDFYLDQYLVTNRDFHRFVAANPEWDPGGGPSRSAREDRYLIHWFTPGAANAQTDHPVVNVTWYAAEAFCQWEGKRLPSEAEWEFAARGGQSALFPWGDEAPDATRANFGGSIGTTTPVDSYPPNRFGLFDMAGNVWQFLSDTWAPYGAAKDKKPKGAAEESATGPKSPAPEPRRVVRGGSFAGHPVNLWVEYRDSHAPSNPREYVGFRCAKSVSN
jgi:sulfatase modifying factor 1